jgi:hypothetical protein
MVSAVYKRFKTEEDKELAVQDQCEDEKEQLNEM